MFPGLRQCCATRLEEIGWLQLLYALRWMEGGAGKLEGSLFG